MAKIATITTHGALNYGAVLQAYALSEYIQELGHTCRVLNYVPPHVDKSYRLIQFPKNLQGIVLSGFQALHYTARKQRRDKFRAFRQENLPLSGEALTDHSSLIAAANEFDTVVCGSDQIWSPVLHGFDEAYFLSFPEVTARRVSYAASFGQDVIDEAVKPELQRRLAVFTDFACRENAGQRLLQELTGKTAPMVLDPVFLLDVSHWKSLARPVQTDKPYSLVYFLSNPGKSPFAIKAYDTDHGLQTLSIGFSPRDSRYGITCRYDLGPLEFLGAIASAQTVLTNSFHCTAFSILLEKNFYTRISGGKNARNDRMITLLKDLGLEDRLYFDADADKLDFEKPIDYTAVRSRLQERIATSKDYLIKILG